MSVKKGPALGSSVGPVLWCTGSMALNLRFTRAADPSDIAVPKETNVQAALQALCANILVTDAPNARVQ